MKQKLNLKFIVILSMIFLAALSRFLPHPPNFTPIGGIALFGAAYFSRKWMAFLIPFVAIWASSLILDNVVYASYYDSFQWFSQPWVFVAFGLIVLLGLGLLKKISVTNLVVSSLSASLIFFLITNFNFWMTSPIYPANFTGLIASYTAGLPFFLNTLAGDLFYVGVLFGSYELAKQKFPQLNLLNR